MLQNTGIPNTISLAYSYISGNATLTTFPAVGTYVKVLGTTTLLAQQKFTVSNSRFTYTGKWGIDCKVVAILGASAPGSASSYTIAIAKNGTVIPAPASTLCPISNNQVFQLVLSIEVSLVTNDYMEVFIRSNSGTNSLTVSEFQFSVDQ